MPTELLRAKREVEYQEKESVRLLKRDSMVLEALYFAGIKLSSLDVKIRPGTWNANQGVIVFADLHGRKYAVPDFERTRKLLYESNMGQDESIGVPHLNNLEIWGNEERRQGMTSLEEWMRLLEGKQQDSHAEQVEEPGILEQENIVQTLGEEQITGKEIVAAREMIQDFLEGDAEAEPAPGWFKEVAKKMADA